MKILSVWSLQVRTASVVAPPPEFIGSGDPQPTTLAGTAAAQLPVTPAISGLRQKLTLHRTWPAFATAYELSPKALQNAVDRPSEFKELANAALFQGSGYPRSSDPAHYSADHLSLADSNAANAGACLIASWAGAGLTPAKKKAMTSEVKTLIASQTLRAERVYTLRWSDQAGTDLYAVMTASPKTGQLRVSGWYPKP